MSHLAISNLGRRELAELNTRVAQLLTPRHTDQGVELHGVDMSRNIALHASAPLLDREDLSFEPRESAAATLLWLKDKIASPLIMFAPPKLHRICPMGASRHVYIRNTEAEGKLLSSQLARMKANGHTPYFGRNHDPNRGTSGYPIDIFWRPQTGIAALVQWTPEAEQQILAGEYNAFSEECLYDTSGPEARRVGILKCCGTLAHRDKGSAYGRYYCAVGSVSRGRAMNDLADLFLQRVDSKATELRASDGGEFSLTHAEKQVGAQWPLLQQAYELRRWLKAEFAADETAVK